AVGDLARQHGARLDENTRVVRLSGSHRVEAIETATERIRPSLVVLASGARAPELTRALRLPLLIEPAKGFSLTYAGGWEVSRRPRGGGEARPAASWVGATGGVTSKLALVGLDGRVREPRIRRSGAQASRFVTLPPGVEGARSWAGLRPLTPDGLPLIG